MEVKELLKKVESLIIKEFNLSFKDKETSDCILNSNGKEKMMWIVKVCRDFLISWILLTLMILSLSLKLGVMTKLRKD